MDTQEALAERHQAPCPACSTSLGSAADSGTCSSCHGKGSVGNCPTCRGKGLIADGDGHLTGCTTCQTKGWIGNCPECLGAGILESGGALTACLRCGGYGHLEIDLRPRDRARFAVIVKHTSGRRFVVGCGPARLRFGRWGRPDTTTDVRLIDPLVTKEHFDIEWNESSSTHEVIDFGRYSLTLNGTMLAGIADRLWLRDRDASNRHALSPGDVLQIGEYTLEYATVAQSDSDLTG